MNGIILDVYSWGVSSTNDAAKKIFTAGRKKAEKQVTEALNKMMLKGGFIVYGAPLFFVEIEKPKTTIKTKNGIKFYTQSSGSIYLIARVIIRDNTNLGRSIFMNKVRKTGILNLETTIFKPYGKIF